MEFEMIWIKFDFGSTIYSSWNQKAHWVSFFPVLLNSFVETDTLESIDNLSTIVCLMLDVAEEEEEKTTTFLKIRLQ